MRRRGVTIIELMVVLAITLILSMGITKVFVDALKTEDHVEASREVRIVRQSVEDRIRALLEAAFVTEDAADFETFFVGETKGEGSDDGADTVTFTTLTKRLDTSFLNSEDDFETLNERFGPRGGVAEIELSTVPYDSGRTEVGVYLRKQEPADGDYTQGGFQELLSNDVTGIAFQFWDGLQWVDTWDTQIERRIPAAVRVTYSLAENPTERFTFVVPLPLSDVTPEDPMATGTSDGTGGGG